MITLSAMYLAMSAIYFLEVYPRDPLVYVGEHNGTVVGVYGYKGAFDKHYSIGDYID